MSPMIPFLQLVPVIQGDMSSLHTVRGSHVMKFLPSKRRREVRTKKVVSNDSASSWSRRIWKSLGASS